MKKLFLAAALAFVLTAPAMSSVLMKHDMQSMYPDDVSVRESASGSGQNRWLKLQQTKAHLSSENPFGSDGNYSLQFAGDDQANIYQSNLINPSLGGNQLTLQAWFKPTAYSQCSVVRLCWPGPDWWSINLGTFSDGRPRMAYYVDGSGWHACNATTALPLNQWSHLAMTYDAGNVKLYVNGAEVASHTVGSSIPLPSGALADTYNGGIGVGGSGGFGNAFGFVDDAMVTDTVIAPSELGYHASFSPYLEPVKETNALYALDDLYDDPGNPGDHHQVLDGSGNGIHGTEGWSYGTYTLSTDDPFGLEEDRSVSVSGTDTIYVYPPSLIDVNNGGRNAFTYEAWFKPTANGGTITSIAHNDDSIVIGQWATGVVGLGFYNATEVGSWVLLQTPAVSAGQWTHAAMTYDGCTLKGYLNGQLVGTKYNRSCNFPMLSNATDRFAISGGRVFGGFNGLISDVRLTQGVLSPAELGYNQSLTPTQAVATSAVATYNMDALPRNKTVTPDSSGNGHNATWVSGLEPSADDPFSANGNNSIRLYGLAWDNSFNYGSSGNLGTFDLFNGGLNEFTIEGWIKPADLYYSTVASITWPTTKIVQFGLGDLGNVRLDTYMGTWKSAAAAAGLPYDQWSHIAGIYKDATLRVYVNGVEVASAYSGAILPQSAPVSVIIGGGGGLGPTNGWLDDIKITKMALPVSELGYYKSFTLPDPDASGITDAKKAQDGEMVNCTAYVSAKFGLCFYIENADRSAGIRVDGSDDGLALGQQVQVVGIMDTLPSGERSIAPSKVTQLIESKIIDPLGMNNKALAGGDAEGQIGAIDSAGLNNIGLLVRTTGRVSDSAEPDFSLTDGSGVAVKAWYLGGVPADGAYVSITGISRLNDLGERFILVTELETVQAAP